MQNCNADKYSVFLLEIVDCVFRKEKKIEESIGETLKSKNMKHYSNYVSKKREKNDVLLFINIY